MVSPFKINKIAGYACDIQTQDLHLCIFSQSQWDTVRLLLAELNERIHIIHKKRFQGL